jgi:hypothetical protein
MLNDVIDFLGHENPLSKLIVQTLERNDVSTPLMSVGAVLMSVGAVSYQSERVSCTAYSGASIEMDFESYATREDERFWHAGFCIGEIQEPDDPLTICITNARDDFIPSGTFCFLGYPLEVENGLAQSTLRHFRDNLTNTDVSLKRGMDVLPVPGRFVM